MQLLDLVGGAEDKFRRIRVFFVDSLLRKLYVMAGPESRANLHRIAVSETREGLEHLLDIDPSAYTAAVPEHKDKQTGFFEKNFFEKILIPKRIVQAEQSGAPLSYVMIDIDNFKSYNDTYGHQFGDEVIRVFSDASRERFRWHERRKVENPLKDLRKGERRQLFKSDLIGRIDEYPLTGRIGHGDEFGLILYGVSQENAKYIMDDFRKKLNQLRIQYCGNEADITISVGIVEYVNGISSKELIRRADKALYEAKERGRNNVQVYNQDLDRKVTKFTPPNPSS